MLDWCWASIVDNWPKTSCLLGYLQSLPVQTFPVTYNNKISNRSRKGFICIFCTFQLYHNDYWFQMEQKGPFTLEFGRVSRSRRFERKKNVSSLSTRKSIVGSLRVRPQTYRVWISNPVSGGQCHFTHLTTLRRLSWPNLAYMCARWPKARLISFYFKGDLSPLIWYE